MKLMNPAAFAGAVLAFAFVTHANAAVGLAQLKVLYVGEPSTSSRARQYVAFLEKNFQRTESATRRGFDPKAANDFDVVLLDWPQSGTSTEQEWKQPSPLGAREVWRKPTVLLGSAGLNLAVVWKVRGGSG